MRRCFLLFGALPALLLLPSPIAFPQNTRREIQKIEFAPFEVTGPDGRKTPAEIGKLSVPENRARPDSRAIELAVVRIKSKSANPGPPVLYLAGGPGGAAIGEAQLLWPILERLRENHDIVLMDQRGTGRSGPVLWLASSSLPTDVFLSEEKIVGYLQQATQQAIESFKQHNLNLMGYNSVESADDLNDLRIAIGAEKISLIGFSYGTHLALATIRRHAPRLDSVVLVGTEGPDHTLKLPSTYDAQLRKLSDLAAQDPAVGNKVPDMVALLRRVLDRLEKEPVTVKIRDQRTKQVVDAKVGKFGLQLLIRFDVGDGNDFPEFPLLFYTIDKGDTSILAKYVEKRYNQLGRGLSGMTAMVDLFSHPSAERVAQIKREARTAILGNVMNFPDMWTREWWGSPDLGDEFRSPLFTNTRTLFISGTLDSNTPPYQAEQLRWGFSNSAHIIVEYAGHEDMLPNPTVQAAIIDFLNGKDVSGVRVSLGRPKFKPIP